MTTTSSFMSPVRVAVVMVLSLIFVKGGAHAEALGWRPPLPLNGWVHERRDRLVCLDDISRQHPPGFRAEVARIMRGPRRDEESIPCVQYYVGTSLYHHLDLASDDVADLFSWMRVPSGLDSRRNQRLHLHDLATWNR